MTPSGAEPVGARRRFRPRLPHTLRGQITAGLVVLLAAACAAVGLATVLALGGFLTGRVDQQLAAGSGRFAASLEHEQHKDADNAQPDTRGQAPGTFGARLLHAAPTVAAVVRQDTDAAVTLSADDRRRLAALPTDGSAHTVHLSALGAYRLVAVTGDDRDVLVTGLPLHPVEETLHRLETTEAAVFGAALAVTAGAGALWIHLSLRPLHKVTATAAHVAELPLATGQVAMPDPLPVTDPRTEAGRLSTAINRMLGHVGDALHRRHTSEERLRHFAADASHELRTPVANIRGHAELALRDPGPAPARVTHALNRIHAESQRMSRLVDDLLLLARLDAGTSLDHRPVDLTHLVLSATHDARAAGPDHHWRLDLPEDPLTVPGDEHRLHQAVANLLANARTHTPAGTTVTIRLAADPSGATTLTVTDTGPGIPPDLLPGIFDRFTRGDPSRSRATGSSGLGLSIAHAVTAAHHGTLTARSRTGRTVFTLTLPADEPPAGSAGDR